MWKVGVGLLEILGAWGLLSACPDVSSSGFQVMPSAATSYSMTGVARSNDTLVVNLVQRRSLKEPAHQAVTLPTTTLFLMADNSAESAETPEAPSPLWLIVMPAIPLIGGGLIYIKRHR